jgi:hypothetical protein
MAEKHRAGKRRASYRGDGGVIIFICILAVRDLSGVVRGVRLSQAAA